MQTLETLYQLAGEINESWCDREAVDWGEAEQLVRQIKNIPKQKLSAMTESLNIITYADAHEDWDSGEVALWPDIVRNEIENFDKEYHYRGDGENWEVFSIALTGEEEWKATVETEAIAIVLAKSLAPINTPKNSCPDTSPIQELANELIEAFIEGGVKLSGETKRVQINLAALTRMDYGEQIVVPVEAGSGELEDLVTRAYDAVEGANFNEDPDYWEKGNCWYSVIKENVNCLAGMRCSKCLSLGPFKFSTKGPDPESSFGMGKMELYKAVENGDVNTVEYMATWRDDGSEDTAGDTEFVLNGEGECLSCGHTGLVKTFKV